MRRHGVVHAHRQLQPVGECHVHEHILGCRVPDRPIPCRVLQQRRPDGNAGAHPVRVRHRLQLGQEGPGNGIGNDNFSVRWTGRFNFAAASHQFTAEASDGIRVWVDGASIINAWKDQQTTTYQATVPLTAGTHEVKVEYYERDGRAFARVFWR